MLRPPPRQLPVSAAQCVVGVGRERCCAPTGCFSAMASIAAHPNVALTFGIRGVTDEYSRLLVTVMRITSPGHGIEVWTWRRLTGRC
jgi:hypothetical protein